MSSRTPESPSAAATLAAAALAAAATDAPMSTEPPVEKIKPISRNAAKLSELVNNSWRVIVDRGIEAEDLDCHPTAWSLLGGDLSEFDLVWAICKDRTWTAEFMVADATTGAAIVKLLRKVPLPPRIEDARERTPPGYSIRRISVETADEMPGTWQTIRLADGVIVGRGFRRREDALRALLDSAPLRSDTTRYLP
jgi:hypothetical protein